MRGWNAYVYRADTEEQEFFGFFFDEAQAKAWVKQQPKKYEISSESPRTRQAKNKQEVSND